VHVLFDSPTFYQQKKIAAFPSDALGAQIGGVLSLWLGVTIMFLLEVFEFVFTLLSALYNNRKKASTNPEESLK